MFDIISTSLLETTFFTFYQPNGHPMELTVLFADISGSTNLYETLGNQEAKAQIARRLNRLAETAKRNQGTLVKTIGDEIMCYFPDAAKAIQAAGAMQKEAESEAAAKENKTGVRIGLHHGPVIREDNDIFGDAVNVAARMTAISKAGQIITTEHTVQGLPPHLASSCRLFDRVRVKGKKAIIAVYQILWSPHEATRLITEMHNNEAETGAKKLRLQYSDYEAEMSENSAALSLGRDIHCDLTVAAKFTSRNHALIRYQRGKFVLFDQSTNGSMVRFQNGESVYLRREELPLWGNGVISLGEPVSENSADLIYFTVSNTTDS
ncbi:MAG: adenylate/guanylate cyclase domain-containing protein [Gammaproteobacteria bacterium]|nr:adenylate/guanylate cyclase domain-containing protein [Gammaproteobacteria bacterium]